MQNAGQQYGQGGASSHQNTVFGHSEPTTTSASGSITSSLRQFRRKPEEKHASQESQNTSESHVARVAPHSHFPANRISDCYTRYQVQYPDYGTPTQVKYSEISEPNQPLQDHLSPSVIQKPKTKDYMEMCNLQQPHMKQAYPDHLGGQQPYTDPNVLSQAQYMPKESQVHSLYKPESQYYPKEPQYPNQLPHQMQKFNMPAQVRKFPENEFLSKLQRIHPSMARSIMSDHHLQESQRTYQNMDQSRMYPHHNQRYINHSTSVQNNLYPHSYMPPQHYPNYPPSCSYTRNTQMAPRFPHINPHDRSISPRRSFSDGVTMPINYGGMPQKISTNYSQYNSPDYAQHYQQRRSSVTQDYYQPHCRPTQYLPPQMPSQEIPESRVTVSDSIKQYIENWADEETATEMNQIENNRLCKENVRMRDDPSTETVYTINASDVQYLDPLVAAESGIPVVASENGQYIIKSGVVDNSSGMIRIIDKNNPMDFGELSGERVVNLHIMDTMKPDCMLASKPNELNQRQATENLYNVNDKSRVVIHQNTVIQSSFQNSSNTKEPVQASNILDHSKLGSSLPVISDEQTSLEEELNRTIIRECKRETADKNCSPINLDQLEDLRDEPVQPSVIYPIKATSLDMDKLTEVDASVINIKNMPILEPHENIEVKQEKLVDEEDKTDRKDDFGESHDEDFEEKLDKIEEKEPNKKQLDTFAENSNEIKENPHKIEENSENIENSSLIEETLNAISEKTGDFEETTYNIQEEIDKIAEETDILNKIEGKLNEIDNIDVQQLNKDQNEDLETASHLSSAEVNKDEIILNNIVKDDTSTKFYSEEHINEQEVLKSELWSLTEKMEQIIEDKTNLTDVNTDIQTSQKISSSDSNSKDLFCSNIFSNNLEVKENTISSDDLPKNEQNNHLSSEQETSDLRNISGNSEFKTDQDIINKEYCDNRRDLPNIQKSSDDTNSDATVLQNTLDSDLTELHKPYEESVVSSKSKRSKRIFSVDDIINNIGNNTNKFKRKEERRYSLKSTKEFLNHEIERASLLMQEIAIKFKHNESQDENFKICTLNKEKESCKKPNELITEANEEQIPSLVPNIAKQEEVSCEEKVNVQSGTLDIQKEISVDDSSTVNSNLTVIEPEKGSIKMDDIDLEEMNLLAERSIEGAHTASVTRELPPTLVAEEISIENMNGDNKTECDITVIPENAGFGESNPKHLVDPDIKNVDFEEECKSISTGNNSDNEKTEEKSKIVEFKTGKHDPEINKVENSEFGSKLENEVETEKVQEKIEILKDHTEIIHKSDIKTEVKVNSDSQLKQDIEEQENNAIQETQDGGTFNPDVPNVENNNNGTTKDQEELYEDKKGKLPENNEEKTSVDQKKQKKELEIKLEKLHKDDSKKSVVKTQEQFSDDKVDEHNPKLQECGQESLQCNQESKCNVELLDCNQLLLNQESYAHEETSEDSEQSCENKGESFENKQELVDNKHESVEYLQESEIEESQHHEIHYRNVIRVEESSVLLHIAGELVEINVNTVNGKRVITVVPLSSSAVVDLNDNYETLDSNEDTDPLKIDGEDKNMEPLEFENLVSQPTFIEPTSEIIIGMDLSLEEEIQLDLEQPQQMISTKAAKKAYESDLQIPSITTSEDVYDHTKINSYFFNDKVSSSHEQCASKKRKNVDERKSLSKNNKTKGKGFKKREIKTVKTMQEAIANDDEDDEFVPFKELIKARKLKKMRQQEIKKNTEIKADSTNKIDEIVKEKNDLVDTKKLDAKNKPTTEKKKDVKKAKTPSMKTGIIKENRQKVKDLKPEKPKLPQIVSGEKTKKATKYSASEKTKKVTFREEVTENSEISEYKKNYLDQSTGKNEAVGGTKISNDTVEGKKKLSLEEYNSRKRKLVDKAETEPSSKRIVTDIKPMPERALESTSATSTGHINKLRMHRPKSLDDVHLLKSRENSFIKRKLSAESCIAPPKSYDWEETQSPKCITKDKHFNEFRGLISGNKETESNSVQPKADNPDVILQNYKEQVESKLSSLNIQIPRAVKPVTNTLSQLINPFSKTETTNLMQRFLRNDRLTSEEMQKIRKIISYKRLMQQLRTINSPIGSSPSLDLKYEVKRELGERDMKLHLKKLPVKKKRRFRNLYSEPTTESESDCGENKTSGDYSVVQSNCLAGVVPKLIIKRKPEMPLPFVKLERLDMGMLINKKRRYVE